jgi:hypothetical protein
MEKDVMILAHGSERFHRSVKILNSLTAIGHVEPVTLIEIQLYRRMQRKPHLIVAARSVNSQSGPAMTAGLHGEAETIANGGQLSGAATAMMPRLKWLTTYLTL